MESHADRETAGFPRGDMVLAVLAGALSIVYFAVPAGNQNAYFFHGYANAGIGFLRNDWMASTTDPFPAFSVIVLLVVRYLPLQTFYFLHFLLALVYFTGLLAIYRSLRGCAGRAEFWPAWAVLLLLNGPGLAYLHPALEKSTVLFADGLAGQYVLGPLFQPSSFGVFALLSIGLFAMGRSAWAVAAVCIAAFFHASYLAIGLVLLFGMAIAAWMEKPEETRLRAMLPIAAGCLVVTALGLVSWWRFRPADALTASAAEELLVHFRFPQHAIVARWFDGAAVVKILLMTAGIVLARGRRLRLPLLFLFAAGTLGTVAVLATGSDALAILFPWRVSVLLAPAATMILLARGVEFVLNRRTPPKLAAPLAVLAIVYTVTTGIASSIAEARAFAARDEHRLFSYIRDHHRPEWQALIPTYLEDFRLQTGVPAFVDHKNHPYRDVEVLDWGGRIKVATRLVMEPQPGWEKELNRAASEIGTTLYVYDKALPTARRPESWNLLFEDEVSALYEYPGIGGAADSAIP